MKAKLGDFHHLQIMVTTFHHAIAGENYLLIFTIFELIFNMLNRVIRKTLEYLILQLLTKSRLFSSSLSMQLRSGVTEGKGLE